MAPRVCIYCGGSRPIYHPVWPGWLNRYLSATPEGDEVHTTWNGRGVSDVFQVHNTLSEPCRQRARLVCSKCNTGWSGTLCEQAKPLVMSLVCGRPSRLTQLEQRIIAAWSAMMVMMIGACKENESFMTSRERAQFCADQVLPANWKIFAGHYNRLAWERSVYCSHSSLWVSRRGTVTCIGSESLLVPIAQTTSIVIGALSVHAFSSSRQEIISDFEIDGSSADFLRRLWPAAAQSLNWPPPRMNRIESALMSSAFVSVAKRATVH